MTLVRDYRRAPEQSRSAGEGAGRPDGPAPCGHERAPRPDAIAPPRSRARSTDAAMRLLGFDGSLAGDSPTRPRSGSFLAVGSGTGAVALSAALAGSERVVASDTDPQAVRTTALTAARHGLSDRVRAVEGDLFSGLGAHERFATVYWHSDFVPALAEHHCAHAHTHAHTRASAPAGYAAHLRYLTEAPRWTEPGGSALLHFSDRGDVPGLWDLADTCGRELRVLRSRRIKEADGIVEHLLFEITVAPVAPPEPAPRALTPRVRVRGRA
ncbi:50S ribosomal protein L11 methyltransferase [Streptomyces sp. NBC_01244]|uniref:50S ribosomal protein L11 methyltransferase n=1 Tax=Streptomyces sp. NBC_01244 TaxID=2903797 RepID=UPI002E131532|nr:50S ribosomal protein L11 methyltransferase [Streptomyces sp. NBC_01244]